MPAKSNSETPGQDSWKPSPESKQQSTTFRIIAGILWVLAIGIEAFAIFRVLKQTPVNMTLLIILTVIIGIFAIGADLLWKRANKMDPASASDTVRFFIQNQLGAIMSLIAFLPLIILILTNKNMDQKQKGIAGGIGVALFLVAAVLGVSINPPSVEKYNQTYLPQQSQTAAVKTSDANLAEKNLNGTPKANQTVVPQANRQLSTQFAAESAVVIGYTGQDLVFWKKDSTVYHLCKNASAINHEKSKDDTIYSGTVADAHAANKDRLTLQVMEETKECGLITPTPIK